MLLDRAFRDWDFDDFCDALGRTITPEAPLTLANLYTIDPQRAADFLQSQYPLGDIQEDETFVTWPKPQIPAFTKIGKYIKLRLRKAEPLWFISVENANLRRPTCHFTPDILDCLLPKDIVCDTLIAAGLLDSRSSFTITSEHPTHLLFTFKYSAVQVGLINAKLRAFPNKCYSIIDTDNIMYACVILPLESEHSALQSIISSVTTRTVLDQQTLTELATRRQSNQQLALERQQLSQSAQGLQQTLDQLNATLHQHPLNQQPHVATPVFSLEQPLPTSITAMSSREKLDQAANLIGHAAKLIAIAEQQAALWQKFAPRYFEHYDQVRSMYGHLEIHANHAELWLPSQSSDQPESLHNFYFSEKQFFDFRKFIYEYRDIEDTASRTDPATGHVSDRN